MHSLYFDEHKTETKIKLYIGKAILNGIKEAECIAHRMYSTQNQRHVVCGKFTKFALYHNLRATISQHCQLYQENVLSISTNTHMKPNSTNAELSKHGC
jgi:hypothetical protein